MLWQQNISIPFYGEFTETHFTRTQEKVRAVPKKSTSCTVSRRTALRYYSILHSVCCTTPPCCTSRKVENDPLSPFRGEAHSCNTDCMYQSVVDRTSVHITLPYTFMPHLPEPRKSSGVHLRIGRRGGRSDPFVAPSKRQKKTTTTTTTTTTHERQTQANQKQVSSLDDWLRTSRLLWLFLLAR